ncbi:DNA cytosine methyltransferase [Helicobacter pylori]|nr:DNA cytosine methyltransferase [Helicobacter pylori]
MAYNVCEFFVGAGGSHLGFIQQGFKTLYVNDIDKDALKTLLHNNKELKDAIIDQTSITEIDPKKLQTQIKQEVDVIFAGIVCKSFSLAGERSPNDKRNYFYRYYLEIIKALRPKISIIENVKGMLNAKILPQNSDPKILQEVDILYQELENYIDYSNLDDIDNLPMQHNPKTIERFKYIQEGKNIQECIESLPKHLQISKFYSRGNTMRLKMDALSPTLVPGHSNFPLHPTEHRSITIREAATITGFPISYKFFGSHTKRCEQVGNAVPIALSSAIAKEVKKFLDSLKSKTI